MKLFTGATLVRLTQVILFLSILAPASALNHNLLGFDLAQEAIRFKKQAAGGNDDSTGCTIRCLSSLAKGVDIVNPGSRSQNPVDAGSSVLCRKYSKDDLESTCKGYADSSSCLDSCLNGTLKSVTENGLNVLKYLCVERRADFEKALPCISDSCAESEQLCKPKCGLINNDTRDKLAGIMEQLEGGTAVGHSSSSSDLMGIDFFGIQRTVAANCKYASCYMNCSKASLTTKCGAMAYELYEGLVWRVISIGTSTFESMGLDSVWPKECKSFTSAYQPGSMENVTMFTIPPIEPAEEASTTTMPQPADNATAVQNKDTQLSSCNGGTCDNRTSKGTTISATWTIGTASIAIAVYQTTFSL